MAELFRMEGISKIFPGVKALDNVSFSVNEGEVHGLVGENGAGKSTLMKVMSGVYRAEAGKMYMRGQEVSIPNVAAAQKLGINIIFQELNLCPTLTVADNIYIGRPPMKGIMIDDRKMHADAKAILDDLGIDINTHAVVRNLSVAKQQMVEIAKAISYDVKLLVLDEPSAALSEKEVQQLMEIIKKLQKRGVGMVYISHRLEELDYICERVTVLRDGQSIGTRMYKDVTMDELVNMIAGREMEDRYPKHKRTIGDVVFEARNVRRGNMLNCEEIKVRKGEILGISGLVGAGRSEIMRAIFGADPADSKEVFMDGKQITINNPHQAIAHGIGFVTEDRKFNGLALGLDVRFNVNMAHIDQLSRHGVINDKEATRNTKHYMDALSIRTPGQYQKVVNLSGGNQQKVVLAKWLCNNVKVLIMDEPTRGIDVGSKFEVYELMNELSDQGVAIIMISSELPEVLGMSDRIIVIHQGEINGEMDAKDATQEKLLYLAAGYNKLEGKRKGVAGKDD
ncbi:sugar ABC transporter ATP-binding protein [Anaerolentibacter hominis]|uniref:sugar ABC transporter ATP-binding protein n=1 Tax=Anaerolentibacter hominis TaxID=3079009 RepID=UPI0031B87736